MSSSDPRLRAASNNWRPAPPKGARWVDVDAPAAVTGPEADVLQRAATGEHELARLLMRMPAVLRAIRNDMAGQPRTPVGDRPTDPDDHDRGPMLWCDVHERSTAQCLEAGSVCDGAVRTGPSDPTGSAAVGPDQARRHHRDLLRHLDRAAAEISKAMAIAAIYPTSSIELPDVEPSPGIDNCRCCWKVNKTITPVGRKRSNNTVYHAGLCLWCGRTRKLLDDVDPPTWLVEMHLRGDRVSQAHLDRARVEIQERTARKKGKRK